MGLQTRAWSLITSTLLGVSALTSLGCGEGNRTAAGPAAMIGAVATAAAAVSSSAVSTSALEVQVLTNSCGANQMQDFFQIINHGSTPVALSDISVKFWADDTSGQTLVPHVWTGGCVTNINGNPSCVHQVSGVTATATSFSPACGPDATHQANWEITISDADGTTLPPGAIWTNLQSAVNLANYSNFTPGTADWFSPCLKGSTYADDSHFAVYFQGTLVFSNGINAPSCRGPHGPQQLSGYYGPPPDPTVAPLVGPVPPTTPLTLDFGLAVQNPDGLHTLIQRVSDPKSPGYRQFLTVPQFQTQFGASATDYQAVINWAQGNGLTVTNTVGSNLLLTVAGTAAQFEQALFANLTFRGRADGTQFVTVDRDPSLNLSTTILRITGLDDFVTPTPAIPIPPAATVNAAGGGNYLSADIRNAYLGPTSSCIGLQGTGQTVGLLELESFKQSDVVLYDAAQTPPLNPSNVVLSEVIAAPLFAPGPPNDAEAILDVSMVQAMAPGAVVHVYQGSTGITGHADSVLHAMANDSAITAASNSWNFGSDDNSQQALNQMAAEGISYFNASGDFGNIGDPEDDRDMDNQTLVGGTQLSTNPVGTPPNVYPNPYYASEDIWSTNATKGTTTGGIMSGPGFLCWPWPFCSGAPVAIPGYQSQVSMATNGGSTTFRNFPDVALLANNIGIFFNGKSTGAAGTSAAAPLWAGFAALVDQVAATNGVGRLGFANPVLYDIGLTRGQSPDLYAKCFNDIADGFSVTAGGGETSVAGYDLISGWGTPTCGLIQQLSTSTPLSAFGELELVIGTGGDDAREDSTITADIFLADNVTKLQTVNVKNGGDSSWSNGSVHQLIIPLDQDVTANGLGNIVFTLTSHNGFIETNDNWNIESVQARLVGPRSPEVCQALVTGDPWMRLTGDNPSATVVAGTGCPAAVNPPPALPTMEMVISTGGDDLRQDSEAQASVFFVGNPTPQVIEVKAGGDGSFNNNTVQVVTAQLTQNAAIDHLELTLISHNGFIETNDNWNVNGMNILTFFPGQQESCQIDLNGDPQIRLTGDQGSFNYFPDSGCP